MDKTLRRWCRETLVQLRKSDPTANAANTSSGLDEHRGLVEAAAFLKLTRTRSIPDDQLISILDENPSLIDRIIEVADSCPLALSTPSDTLGEIHQFLIGQCDALKPRSARGGKQKRKSEGIFYTPRPVVDYIVRQTVGARLVALNPDQVRKLTILDPAAGCGAFLAGAYRHLLQWHLQWFQQHDPLAWPDDVKLTERGWQLTVQRAKSILESNLFGVDRDADALVVARRILFLTLHEYSTPGNDCMQDDLPSTRQLMNLRPGNSLLGRPFAAELVPSQIVDQNGQFDWTDQFPNVANHGGFDFVIGNPPYRRELNFKQELDAIHNSSLGQYRSARMDLWYYFVHRGIQLLRDGGQLSFITNAYWVNGRGAEKLVAALRNEVHLDEIFLLGNTPIFEGVTGQHSILRLTKDRSDLPTTIKHRLKESMPPLESLMEDSKSTLQYTKTSEQLFRGNRLDIWPPSDSLVDQLGRHSRLGDLGIVRQGIAENPATVNQRTVERFPEQASVNSWHLGEGVFSLTPAEYERLNLAPDETLLTRSYHDLCDLGRYWMADCPSRRLIYSTRATCPEIESCPSLESHLTRFRAILDVRRETLEGQNRWWHLHWPRDETLWRSTKIVALQMSDRPGFVPAFQPVYVSFSANVFVASSATREDLRYLVGLLNSKTLWAWFILHAKHRGIGLEVNGHTLRQAPIRRIDFQNPNDVGLHDKVVLLVDDRLELERARRNESANDLECRIEATESQIDSVVTELYQLDATAVDLVDQITTGRIEQS